MRSSGAVYIVIQNILIFLEPLRYPVCEHKHILSTVCTCEEIFSKVYTVLCKPCPLQKFVRPYRFNGTYSNLHCDRDPTSVLVVLELPELTEVVRIYPPATLEEAQADEALARRALGL